jgi:caa(3)-type oxidase subunit IV
VSDHADHAEHAHEDHSKHYIKIWVVLLVLLCISILGPELEIQIVTLVTAFGIAFVKAYLVMKEFMHLNVEKPIVHWFLATALVFMVLLFAAVAPDVMKHDGSNWTRIQTVDPGIAALNAHGGGHGDSHGAADSHADGADHKADDKATGADHGAEDGHH